MTPLQYRQTRVAQLGSFEFIFNDFFLIFPLKFSGGPIITQSKDRQLRSQQSKSSSQSIAAERKLPYNPNAIPYESVHYPVSVERDQQQIANLKQKPTEDDLEEDMILTDAIRATLKIRVVPISAIQETKKVPDNLID